MGGEFVEQRANEINSKRLIVVSILITLFIIFDVILLGFVLLYKLQPQTYRQMTRTISHMSRKITKNKVPAANFDTFMQNLQADIMLNWNPPKIETNARVVVLMKIQKDGNLESVQVLKSSGNSEMDNVALETVKATAPFQPLPLSFTGETVDVNFSFNYNAQNAE